MAANTLAATGFNDSFQAGGAAPTYAQRTYQIVSTLTSQIAFGDPVRFLASGYIDKYASGGTTICGIFKGCRYFDVNAGRKIFSNAWKAPTLSANTIVEAFVVNDPMAVFQVQANGAVAVAQSNVGANVDITVGSSGSMSLSGLSTCSVLTSSIATTGTLPFKILRIVGYQQGVVQPALFPGYDGSQANNWVEVTFNTNALLQTTGI